MAGILGAIAAYASGEMTIVQLIEAIMVALGGMSLRAGISKIGQ